MRLVGPVLVVVLSWLTFSGKRVASRLLAAYIASGVMLATWEESQEFEQFDVYLVYRAVVMLYFAIGAIKLWFVKELPTRFTDPPTQPPAHA
ncbi:MAG: hypothetical protein KKA55_07880 [Proteobacteria bacterium]|nr:hypothetical protein [Pseudomonadota bacterium]MBU1595437.1 hypothetical protein [Pseudomonadota bacterium]